MCLRNSVAPVSVPVRNERKMFMRVVCSVIAVLILCTGNAATLSGGAEPFIGTWHHAETGLAKSLHMITYERDGTTHGLVEAWRPDGTSQLQKRFSEWRFQNDTLSESNIRWESSLSAEKTQTSEYRVVSIDQKKMVLESLKTGAFYTWDRYEGGTGNRDRVMVGLVALVKLTAIILAVVFFVKWMWRRPGGRSPKSDSFQR